MTDESDNFRLLLKHWMFEMRCYYLLFRKGNCLYLSPIYLLLNNHFVYPIIIIVIGRVFKIISNFESNQRLLIVSLTNSTSNDPEYTPNPIRW